jgi:ElaB/YqjD/DUF883 family membrane-anchored ribosome-binding protein
MSQRAYAVEQPDNSFEPEAEESAEVLEARARVEQARTEMGSTIDAIKEKLEPSHLVEQAKETVREATIGKAQHAMGDVMDRARDTVDTVSETAQDYTASITRMIRDNPIPAAMIGIGVCWLLMESRKNGSSTRYTTSRRETWYPDSQTTHRYEEPAWTGGTGYQGERHEGGVRQAAARVGDRAGEMVGRVQDRAGEMVGRVQEKTSEMAQQVRHQAGEMADRVQDSAHNISERARYQTRQTVRAVENSVDENPLAVGAVALAIGAALGFLLPTTHKERELMGEARDRVMDRAQNAAQEIGQKVKHVAREAADIAKTEAEKQGLAPRPEEMQNLGQKIKDVAQNTMQAVKEEAKDEGLMPGQTSQNQQRAA